MENVELKHIQPYLPYKVKVQYEGILNGKEISDYKKKWKQEHDGGFSLSYDGYNEPKEITGLKLGFIKEVGYYNNYTKYRIGVKSGGLQTHYSADRFKMVLKPMSDLTQEELRANGFDNHLDYLTHEKKDPLKAPCEMTQYLFSKLYDVYGLIGQDKAISINNLK
jgi:hypothetical protein